MARETHETVINGHHYELVQHPAEAGFKLMAQLAEVAGESFGDLLDAIGNVPLKEAAQAIAGTETSSLDGEKLGKAIHGLARRITSAGGPELCKEILRHTLRTNEEGKQEKVPACFNRAYQGNYGELWAALWWALKCNFETAFRLPPF